MVRVPCVCPSTNRVHNEVDTSKRPLCAVGPTQRYHREATFNITVDVQILRVNTRESSPRSQQESKTAGSSSWCTLLRRASVPLVHISMCLQIHSQSNKRHVGWNTHRRRACLARIELFSQHSRAVISFVRHGGAASTSREVGSGGGGGSS